MVKEETRGKTGGRGWRCSGKWYREEEEEDGDQKIILKITERREWEDVVEGEGFRKEKKGGHK